MVEDLKREERNIKKAAEEIKRTFLKPVYYDVEGISILLGEFWVHPAAEMIWMKTLQALADIRMEISAREKKEGK